MPTTRRLALPRAATPSGLLRRLFAALILRRSRARLAALDDHILRDIGLSRAEAEAESRRALWDVPDHWRGSARDR
ncbi:MAG: DUF1127 domain-containing protein [Gemmobacter sp.]